MTQRWDQMWTQLAASGEAADRRLDQVAWQIAADARAVLRSGIGFVFHLDATSGALHSLGLDGEVVPAEAVPAVRRGQVLLPGCGCAGRAVALRKPFVAPEYGSGCVVVPPIMAEAVATLPTFTTLSFPLIVGHDIIGAVTVGRLKTTPFISRGSLRQHPEFADFPEYLRRAHGEAKRAAEIVDRLLDHVSERTPALDRVDLRSIVADAVAIVTATAAARGTTITVTGDDVPVVVRADSIMLRQVVLNLVNNALDAIDGPGKITVRTRIARNVIGPARAVVSVSDTGRGVPAEQLLRMFEPFFTTKEVGQGVGRGLGA